MQTASQHPGAWLSLRLSWCPHCVVVIAQSWHTCPPHIAVDMSSPPVHLVLVSWHVWLSVGLLWHPSHVMVVVLPWHLPCRILPTVSSWCPPCCVVIVALSWHTCPITWWLMHLWRVSVPSSSSHYGIALPWHICLVMLWSSWCVHPAICYNTRSWPTFFYHPSSSIIFWFTFNLHHFNYVFHKLLPVYCMVTFSHLLWSFELILLTNTSLLRQLTYCLISWSDYSSFHIIPWLSICWSVHMIQYHKIPCCLYFVPLS